jgi:DnaJ homologue, subfamily C, member 28, conserved domain
MFSIVVERLILEAIKDGKFAGLRGEGRPIDLSTYFETPAEVRVAYAALQSAGVAPREVDLLREIAVLEGTSGTGGASENAQEKKRQVQRLRLELSLLLERTTAGRRD